MFLHSGVTKRKRKMKFGFSLKSGLVCFGSMLYNNCEKLKLMQMFIGLCVGLKSLKELEKVGKVLMYPSLVPR